MIVVLTRNWWALALRGVAAVLFGLAAIAWPGLTILSLALLFGIYALTDGTLALAAVLNGRTGELGWGAMLAEGLLGITAGIVALAAPGLTALTLLYLIAAWAVVTGVFEIVVALRLRKAIEGEWLLALGGILSILFGVGVAMRPAAGAVAVAWLIGLYAMLFGVLLLVLAFRLRSRTPRAQHTGA